MRPIVFFVLSIISFSLFATNSHYEKALVAYENEKIDEAYVHLKNALKEAPDNLPSKILMGKVLVYQGDFSQGVTQLNEALEIGADLNLFLNDLGNALMLTGNFTNILTLGDNSNLNAANHISWQLLKGNAFNELGQTEDARNTFRAVLNRFPSNINALTSLIALNLQQGDYSNASTLLEQAKTLHPQNSRTWFLQGQLYDKQKNSQQALLAYEKAYQYEPKDPVVHRALAHSYTQENMSEKALHMIELVLESTPSDPFAILLQSQLSRQASDDQEDLLILQDISKKLTIFTTEQKLNNASLSYLAGTAAYLQKNYELAQIELNTYINKIPDDIAGINMLSNIYLKQGQANKAKTLLERKELVIRQNLPLSLKLVNIYLKSNQTYKAEALLNNLAEDYENSSTFTIARANTLAKRGLHQKALELLLANEPADFDANYLLTSGVIHLALKQFERADTIADKLLQTSLQDTNFLSFKGNIKLQQGQWQQAITLFENILEINPDSFTSRFNIASAMAAQGNYDQARELTSQLLIKDKNNLQLKILVAKLDRDSGDHQEAINSLKDVITLDSDNIEATELLLELYLLDNKLQDALFQSKRLTKITFLEPKYIQQQAEILIQLNQIERAKRSINTLIGLAETPGQLSKLSQLQKQVGDDTGAKVSLEKAVTMQPDNISFQLEIIRLDIQLGNIQLAQNRIKKQQKRHKNNPNILLLQGDIYTEKGRLELAQQLYMQAIMADNNFNTALIRLYQLTLDGIGVESFRKNISRIVKQVPGNHMMRNLLADYYLNQNMPVEAKEHYEVLLDIDNLSNKPSVLNNLANILVDSDVLLAENYSKQAVELGAATAPILDTYGWILCKSGKVELGLTHLRQAYAMDSTSPAINYHIGYALYQLGRKEEATNALHKAVRSNKDFSEKDEAKGLLAKLLDNTIEI